MAAGTLPEPGTEYGPCDGGCEHRDCRQTRTMAESKCAVCEGPVGYGRRFYNITNDPDAPRAPGERVLAHASCWEDREESTTGGGAS